MAKKEDKKPIYLNFDFIKWLEENPHINILNHHKYKPKR